MLWIQIKHQKWPFTFEVLLPNIRFYECVYNCLYTSRSYHDRFQRSCKQISALARENYSKIVSRLIIKHQYGRSTKFAFLGDRQKENISVSIWDTHSILRCVEQESSCNDDSMLIFYNYHDSIFRYSTFPRLWYMSVETYLYDHDIIYSFASCSKYVNITLINEQRRCACLIR